MKQVYKINDCGYFIEPILIEEDEELPCGCVETPFEDGLYKPKWEGSQWVEGLSQEEIDEKESVKETQEEIERMKSLPYRTENTEDAVTTIMDQMIMLFGTQNMMQIQQSKQEGNNKMYQFILNMWVFNRITEQQVRSYVGVFITQQEADQILATPQVEQ